MDRLQKAIQKAREKRDGIIGQTLDPSEALGHEAGLQINSSGQARVNKKATADVAVQKQAPHPRDVHYSVTRTVDLDEDCLNVKRVIAGNVHDPRVESYRQLRSQILRTMNREKWQTLAITSAQESAGKTLTSVNLAISISQEVNQTVMLVDLDLRKPSVHKTLGLEVNKGIVDHLKYDEPIENILINPGYPRLVVLPGLPQGQHSSEVLTTPAMKRFNEEITARYPDRIIIFDLPPLLRNDDAMSFAPYADACLMVVEHQVTTADELKRSKQLLNHANLLGSILNKVR